MFTNTEKHWNLPCISGVNAILTKLREHVCTSTVAMASKLMSVIYYAVYQSVLLSCCSCSEQVRSMQMSLENLICK